MKRLALVALAMAILTGCSGGEDAFIGDARKIAGDQFSDEQLLTTGEIACGMMKEGKEPDLSEKSVVTGVTWVVVWIPAQKHLC